MVFASSRFLSQEVFYGFLSPFGFVVLCLFSMVSYFLFLVFLDLTILFGNIIF